MSWTLDGRPVRRVLVTRLRYLGDVVMSTVVVDVLKRGDPSLAIDFLCEASHATVLQGHPNLAQVHGLGVARRGADAAARAPASASNRQPARGTPGTIVALRRRRFDLAVDLFFNPRSAWLLRLAGIPSRIGGTLSTSRRRLYTHAAMVPDPADQPALYATAGGGLGEHCARLSPLRHEGVPFLEWFARTFGGQALGPRLAVPEMTDVAHEALAFLDCPGGPPILAAPGATWPSKEWPLEHWRSLLGGLVADGYQVAVLQPPGRPEVAAALAPVLTRGHGGVLPVLALGDALAVLARAGRVISVDGGIMHAAVGLGRPTLALFGPTQPALWFPYESCGPFRVLATRPACHPCHRHTCDQFVCLPDLRPDQVRAALEELPLDGRAGS